MRERPMLFSGEMVRALLAGKKTQTRRMIPVPHGGSARGIYDGTTNLLLGARTYVSNGTEYGWRKPPANVGDRIWVKETWAYYGGAEYLYQREPGAVSYRATFDGYEPPGGKWKPSIHMPRWASRITLEVVSVRVEWLQEISEADAQAEGVETLDGAIDVSLLCGIAKRIRAESARAWFAYLWESIHGAGSWDANPWVWVIEFRRVDSEVG